MEDITVIIMVSSLHEKRKLPGKFLPRVSNSEWVEGRGRYTDAPPEGRGSDERREADDLGW